MTTIYAQHWEQNHVLKKIVMSVPDDTDLSSLNLPEGTYIAERNGSLFNIRNRNARANFISPLITGPVVKFVRHHSHAIPKGTIALVVDARHGSLLNKLVVTSSTRCVYVSCSMLRNHSIDRLSPKLKEWATMYLLENG